MAPGGALSGLPLKLGSILAEHAAMLCITLQLAQALPTEKFPRIEEPCAQIGVFSLGATWHMVTLAGGQL